ncbi:ADP-ribosylation factor-like protein [Candidatus Harpocratesius sp.]
MRKTETGDKYLKIVYWGCYASGKTTAVDTLFKIIQERPDSLISPEGELTKIATPSGATNYFDRGIVKSVKQNQLFYHIYTVAGQKRFLPLRTKVFFGADAVILVLDGQKDKMNANEDSIAELTEISELPLVEKIPLVVMINKQDLKNVVSKEEVITLLTKYNLYFPENHINASKNPQIFETIALYGQYENIYESFIKIIEKYENWR